MPLPVPPYRTSLPWPSQCAVLPIVMVMMDRLDEKGIYEMDLPHHPGSRAIDGGADGGGEFFGPIGFTQVAVGVAFLGEG